MTLQPPSNAPGPPPRQEPSPSTGLAGVTRRLPGRSTFIEVGLTRLWDARGRWALPCVLLLGAALRVALWAQDRSLWIDESRLAINIASRTLSELARPLAFDQVAPVPFLWVERCLVVIMGVNEAA